MKNYEKLLYDYADGIGSLQERIEEGDWWKDPYTYEGLFIDIDWLAPARVALEKVAPKKVWKRIKELDNKLLKVAEILAEKDPYVLEYLVESLGDVIPQLRHLLRATEAETTKS